MANIFKDKNMKRRLFFSAFGLALGIGIYPSQTNAHSGRTNKSGCHNNRKTVGYHCHNGGTSRGSSYSASKLGIAGNSAATNYDIHAKSQKVMTAQIALNSLGFNVGRVDGKLGSGTRTTVRRYQSNQKFITTGSIDDKLIYELTKSLSTKVC